MLYIGVDLGTSSVKLLVMDQAGEIKNINKIKCCYGCYECYVVNHLARGNIQ